MSSVAPSTASAGDEVGVSAYPAAAAWAVLPGLLANPHSDPLAVAGAFVALGLPELAREALSAASAPVSGSAREDDDALDAMASSRIESAELLRNVRRGLDAAGPGLSIDEADVEAWTSALESERWYRASDGNVVRVRAACVSGVDGDTNGNVNGDAGLAARVIRLADDRGAAASVALPTHTDTLRPPPPVCLDGVAPPWMLMRLATGWGHVSEHGARGRLWVVQRDPRELLDGLAHADLSGALSGALAGGAAEGSIRWLVGEDAPARLEAALREHEAFVPAGISIVLPTVTRRTEPAPGAVMKRLGDAGAQRARTLAASLAQRGVGRDAAWWAARYAAALGGDGPPLRVLVPTCRFSSYVGAAAGEIARAFEANGCEARVLQEPTDWLGMTPLAVMDAVDAFDPDLVLTINYPREQTAGALPPYVPVVCWMQDAPPHLFGAWCDQMGPLDFLVGHRFPEHKAIEGMRGRLLISSVPACGRTFDGDPAEAFDCELAVLMNHGEPADVMLGRLIAEEGIDQRLARGLAGALVEMQRLTAAPATNHLRDEVHALATSVARSRAPAMAARLERHILMPLADRLLRHTVVGWAERVCERRGWRMRLHGRGWSRYPSSSQSAQSARWADLAEPPIAHGPALRDAYRGAAVTLHASAAWLMHQRVLECAMSGGFPGVLVKRCDVADLHELGVDAISRRGRPFAADLRSHTTFALVADDPATMALAAHLQRLRAWCGTPDMCMALYGFVLWYPGMDRKPRHIAGSAAELRLLADLPDTGFYDEASLEALVERAMTRPSWRSGHVRRMARCARASFTYEHAAGAIASFVHRGLSHAGETLPKTRGAS